MSIITFIIILCILVLVHELGHFLVAKKFGVRVDEFSIGFPPRLIAKKFGETLCSLNLIPFGGYVKIFGENNESNEALDPRSFAGKPKSIQIAILSAGIIFNVIFAWLLLSFGFSVGLPTAVGKKWADRATDQKILILNVLPGTPAEKGGLVAGDQVITMSAGGRAMQPETADNAREFIASTPEKTKLQINILRKGESLTILTEPANGIVDGKKAIGVAIENIGILKLPVHLALVQGFVATKNMVISTGASLGELIGNVFVGKGTLAGISGPVGLAGMVGEAGKMGFTYLLTLTALISVNLAMLNLIPFPALDGGRILFAIIEKIRGKNISANVALAINGTGFALLIILMLVVTYKDIARIFNS